MTRPTHLTAHTGRHLSDEQMYTLLEAATPDQPAPPESDMRLHLLSCTTCRNEFASLRHSLADLRVATTHMATARVPALGFRRKAELRPFVLRHGWAASVATASVALAVSLTLLHPWQVRTAAVLPAQATVAAPEAAVSDEALLDGIQQDLSTSVPPPLQPLEVSGGAGLTQD